MNHLRVLFVAVVVGLAMRQVAASEAANSLQRPASGTSAIANTTALDRAVKIEMEDRGQANTPPKTNPNLESDSAAAEKCEIEKTLHALYDTTIPQAEFRDVRFEEVLDFVSKKTGLPMLLMPFEDEESSIASGTIPNIPGLDPSLESRVAVDPKDIKLLEPTITLSLRNASAAKVLLQAAVQLDDPMIIGPGVVVFTPFLGYDMFPTENYHIPRNQAGAFERDSLKSRGVEFPPGSGIGYNPSTEILTVRNKASNLALIEDLRVELLFAPGQERHDELERESEQKLRDILEWEQTLASMIVRDVEIQNASMEEVVRKLRPKINCWIGVKINSTDRITVSMKNCSALDMLERIANMTKSRVVIGSYFIVFLPAEAGAPDSPKNH